MFAQNCDFNEIDENEMRNASCATQSHTCIKKNNKLFIVKIFKNLKFLAAHIILMKNEYLIVEIENNVKI